MAIIVNSAFKPKDGLGLYRAKGENPLQPGAEGGGQHGYPALEGNPDNGFNTPLTAAEEQAFQAWKAKYAPNDSGDDYDLRGAFRAGVTPDPQSGHFPDTFKKPNHPTFSTESEYAQYAPELAGSWDADGNYIPTEAVARQRQIEQNAAADAEAHAQFDQLEQQTPGRYKLISANDYDKWQADWDKQNRSTGLLGDTVRLLDAGTAEVEQGLNEIVGRIPGIGKPMQDLANAFDHLAYGSKSYDERMQSVIDKDIATLTPETKSAREESWWNDKTNSLGAAWLNPRSYFAGVVESLPSTALTMFPAMGLARGAYLGAMAAGATREVAAAAAAKTALVAGAITEGGFGGAQSAQTVRQQIAQIPREKLLQTQSVQTLISQGLSEDDAIKAITEDAATQAFIMGGVATGVFGGFGDRFLAKLIAEGVGGGIAKRIVSGATRGIVSEGLLEELPQNATQQVAQNLALKNTVNPDQDLTEGVADQALGGLAVGAAMGAGFGGVGGAVRPAESAEPAPAPAPPRTSEPFTPNSGPLPVKPGPLATAVQHGLEQAPMPAPADDVADVGEPGGATSSTRVLPDENPPEVTPVSEGNLPSPGSNVVVEAPGLERFTGQVQSYEEGDTGLEAMVADKSTGEVLQVPITALRTAKLTDQDVVDLARRDEPPIEREQPQTPPPSNAREVQGENVVMPDDRHAALYDFGRKRRIDKGLKRNLGDDGLKMNELYPEERKRLADMFEIPVDRVNELADDYAYRVERVGRQGTENGLPINMHTVSDTILTKMQNQRLRAEKAAAKAAQEIPEGSDHSAAGKKVPELVPATGTIDEAAHEAATSPTNDRAEPTQAQKEAGNYKLGHYSVGGLDLSIENPAGSTRSGVDKGGKPWSVTMKSHYGYIKGTVGKDKDHIDVFVKRETSELGDDAPVFVVDQHTAEGFDEHKVMLGFKTVGQARNAYLANYAKGWKGLKAITPTTLGEFKQWLKSGDTTKPFAAPATLAETATVEPERGGVEQTVSRRQELRKIAEAKSGDAAIPAWVHWFMEHREQEFRAAPDDKALLALFDKHYGSSMMGAGGPGYEVQTRVGELTAKVGTDTKRTFKGTRLATLLRQVFPRDTPTPAPSSVRSPEVSTETVDQRLTDTGPWDFNDTYPTPDLEQVRRLDRDGRESFEHDDAGNFDVEAVASSLDEALQELEIRRLDYLQARHDINEITAGRKKVRGSTDQELKRLAQSWKEDEQAIEDLLAAHRDVFPERAVKALRKEAFDRADRRWAQMDKGAQVRIPKGQRKEAPKPAPTATAAPRAARPLARFDVGPNSHPIMGEKNDLIDWVNSLPDEQFQALLASEGGTGGVVALRNDIGISTNPPQLRALWQKIVDQPGPAADRPVAPIVKPDLEELGDYARSVVGPQVRSVTLVGSVATKGEGHDVDLLYDLGPHDLPDNSDDAGEAVEQLVEQTKIDAERFDSFFRVGDRYFHLSGGAGQAIVENTEYANEQKGRPSRVLATARLADASPAPPPAEKPAYGASNKLVSPERAEELRAKLRAKMLNQLSSGLDPEILAMGAELAAFHIEAGARKFADFARKVAADLGTTVDKLRPYLRAWYNGARDLMEDSGLDIAGMETPDEVRAALATLGEADEPAKLDGSGPGPLEAVPPADVRGAEGERDAGPAAEPGGGADVPRGQRARGQRDATGRGVAAGAREVPAPAGRDLGELAAGSGSTPAQNRADDFTITDADEIGRGGAKTKFRNNVAAIELLRELTANDRPATRDEQATLAKWVGWGGLAAAFYREDGTVPKGWEKEAAEIKALLSPEEYRAAAASTRNAHYTSPEVVSAMWSIVDRLGFTGGRVLEPSVGAGNFIGLMPAALRDNAQVHGAELDTITGGIAKNLYPKANIQVTGFQALTIPDDYFDLAIGNPPFGSEKLYDAERRALNKFSIHNYFLAKSIDTLKPGGVLAMVVSNYFMDAANAAARNYIADRANLLGAIRLPNDAFLANAGTEVTTDIVVFQKRPEGARDTGREWTGVGSHRDEEGRTVPLNAYFVAHPDMMLGKFGAYGEMYRDGMPALVSRPGQDLAADLKRAVATLPAAVMTPAGVNPTTATEVAPTEAADALVNSMFLTGDGTVMLRQPDEIGTARAVKVEFPNEKAAERVAGMIRVRDVFTRLRQAQIDESSSEAKLTNLRERLNKAYDTFVAKHGLIHSDANRRLFRDDPTWPQLAALEDGYDKGISEAVAAKTGEQPRAPSARKAAIFTKRTQAPYSKPQSAATAKDALAAVLSDRGTVDLEEMSRLYGKPVPEVIRELGGLLYKSPDGTYETADQYLSGNVKKKLAQATEALARDPDMARNIEALREVIPADIEPVDIDVKAGAPWIPGKHMAAFIEHVTEAKGAKATYAATIGRWSLTFPRGIGAAVEARWGTDRVGVDSVIEAAINGKTLTVSDKAGDKSVVNPQATDAANEKVNQVKAEWSRWIWEDDARREELARLYNDTFNTDVIRAYDGSHLQLPGKVSDDVIALRPHQKNYVWRGLQTGTILADHTVGAGKTFANIALIMEKRRTGQAKKPLLTVPNHLVGQWAADFIKLYPGANILAATKADFEGPNRRKLFARIATGDWDAVIVAHSSFKYLPVDPRFEKAFIEQQIADMQDAIAVLREADGKGSRTVKQMEKAREVLDTRLQRLLDAGAKDEIGMTFEDMGIDFLGVDEAHEFKNLGFATSMQRVAGLGNTTGSQKAADLFMKVTSVLDRTGGRNVAFMTGTPISNTMAEMFTMQRYLDYRTLRDLGIAHFDAWARVFGEVVTDWELSPSGKYKQNSRFAKFVNMPELMQRYLSFADVITNDDIQRQLAERGQKLPIPKIKGGKPTNIVVDRSPQQANYIGVPQIVNGEEVYPEGSLVYRAEHLPKKAEKGDDNMLKVMSDARKAALDMRLIDPSYGDYGASKVHRAAAEIYRLFRASAAQRGTQLVFIDLSTPKAARSKDEARIRELMQKAEAGDEAAQEALDNMSPDEFLALNSSFSVYDDLREKLIALGIPPKEIAFIHDANTDAQKQELFAKVRAGQVRVLFGSTPKMGAGTNVQNRLVALHHMDAPWRPSDLEQRDGRGIRQGNELYEADPQNFEIEILRYATKNTLDARQWQTIEGKARFIAQLRKGDIKDRVVEDVAGEAANAAEMKAAASGNPLILEEIELKQKIRKLEGASSEHDRAQHRIRFDLRALRASADDIRERLAKIKADADAAIAFAGRPLKATIGGADVEKPKELGEAIIAVGARMLEDGGTQAPLGKLGDFTLTLTQRATKTWTDKVEHTFQIVIAGQEQHGVEIDDLKAANPTGTGMRVLNVIRDLAHAPANAETRIAEAEKQIVGLEKQVGPWNGAAELDKVKERHRDVLAQLRPKSQAQPTTAPAAPSPKAEFSADEEPIALTGNELGAVRDIASLRKAALNWYNDNLVGDGARTKDGILVTFTRAGAKELASGAKSEALLKAIPAIRSIIERGRVVRREAVSHSLPKGDTSPAARGARLASVREALGKKQAAMAAALGLSPQRYGTYERLREPPADVLHRIRQVTGATSDFILFGEMGGMPVDLVERMKATIPPEVKERIVIAAPVSIDGKVRTLALTVHGTPDGKFAYDLAPLPEGGTGEFSEGGEAAGVNLYDWLSFDGSTDAGLSDEQRQELTDIVRTVSGLSEVQFRNRIVMPANNAGWGNDAPRTAGGFYDPVPDLIALAETSGPRQAYHEAFHRLQRLFLTPAERKVLAGEASKLRRIVAGDEFRGPEQAKRMSQKELEAEAFAIWATGAAKVQPYKPIAAAWGRIKAALQRTINYFRGLGFQTAEDVFGKAKAGEISAREARTFQQAWHGTAAGFDEFDNAALGSGEGNASYGVGHYFASSKEVANFYRTALSRVEGGGRLVKAEIPGNADLLNWDAPLSDQSPKVQARIAAFVKGLRKPLLPADMSLNSLAIEIAKKELTDPATSGETIYNMFSRLADKGRLHLASQQAAGGSRLLASIGIPGHRYIGHESKTTNYVIYDAGNVRSLGSEFDAAGDVTSPAFKRWFGKSKVVDAKGRPLVVYHGTAAQRLGRDGTRVPINFDTFSTKNEMGAHFGTIDQAEARVGEPSEVNRTRFYPVYLSIQNPLRVRDVGEFSFDTLARDLGDRGILDDADEWLDRYDEVASEVADGRYDALERVNEDFKDHLKSLGYDGLVYLNRGESNVDPDDPDISSLDDEAFKRKVPSAADSWVAFDASQVKSAIANRGTFSPTDPRIQYSMAEAVKRDGVVRAVGDEAAGRWLDVQPKLLAAVPLTYFGELARPNMSAVANYLKVKRDMDAYRGTKHAAADTLAQKWLKYTRLGFGLLPSKDGKAAAERLASLMHDATLEGVDPSKDDVTNSRHPAYPGLRARYNALPASGKALFGEVRDAYAAQAAEMDKLILESVEKAQKIALKKAEEAYQAELDRIQASGLSGLELKDALAEANERYGKAKLRNGYANRARITQLRKAFEASRVPAPYFPLARFGRYFVTVRDRDGSVVSFSRRESARERNELARDMRAAYPGKTVETGVMDEAGAGLREAMDPRIVAEIEGILAQGGVNPDVMDAIWQRYLQSLPDLSTRKRFIHRKGTAGFDSDALRAFSSHMFHAGHQMARIKYGVDLQEMLDQAAIQARKADDPTRGMTLANELAKRHKWVMNPTGSEAVQFVTSAMFVWYLGLTPAAALVNLTQTPMLGIPIIGAKYGMAKTAAALVRASADFVGGKGNAADSANLTHEERWALERFHESGLIDRTRSHDLAGVGNTGVNYSPLRARVMSVVSWAFHKAEVANREVTALAAFRLARAAGESEWRALDSAHDLTWKVHFDYSNSSRPRLLQSDAAKLLLVFQNYQLNMWYRLFRDIHQSFKGDTPQARKEARLQVAGIMGMMTLLGGVTGFFGFHALMALAGLFFGDKDDPYDFEDQMKRHVIELFGPDVGGMILNGVPGKLLNIDLTSRIGMPDFFVRAPDQPNLDGRDWWKEFIVGALGAVPNTIINWGDGLNTIASGKTIKGVEMLMPKALRDVMQAYRFANEGLTTRNGDQILPADTLGAWQTISKVIGFTPASVSEAYDRNNALKSAEARISDERSILLNQLAMAIENGDDDTRALVLERIKAFNAVPVHRSVAITAETIRRSLAARRRNATKREDGVLIQNPGLSRALRQLQPARTAG